MNIAPPALWRDYGVLPIKKKKTKVPRGVNRRKHIYDTTKRNYFVIRSNLHCSEHPWNPTKLTGGNCFHVARTTIPLLSNYCLWSILNLFESRWREGHIFNNATRHINVFRNHSFYVNGIYVFGVEIQIWSCKHVADVGKMDTRHRQKSREEIHSTSFIY